MSSQGTRDNGDYREEAYGIQNKILAAQNQIDQYSSSHSNKIEERSHNPALSDVKNRLATMQRNKEDLEEKLRSYEAKIRQHFNR
jgi:hypothetical protein